MDSLRLGASLYVPTTHPDMVSVGNRERYPNLRSVIYCTEDAVSEKDLNGALENLAEALGGLRSDVSIMRYVRVRNPEVLARVLEMPGISKIDGFVLPKVTSQNVHSYFSQIKDKHFLAMVTLETRECFDNNEMIKLRNTMLEQGYDHQTLCLRIGGNDLLNVIGMRRVRHKTIYETPVGQVISNLVGTFKPFGFQLSAPVCEYMDDTETLNREIEQDLAHGLVGKTAIHPCQIDVIESRYRVCPKEIEQAQYLLSSEAKAVHKMHDSMLEVTTHSVWAQNVIMRADIYGVAA